MFKYAVLTCKLLHLNQDTIIGYCFKVMYRKIFTIPRASFDSEITSGNSVDDGQTVVVAVCSSGLILS